MPCSRRILLNVFMPFFFMLINANASAIQKDLGASIQPNNYYPKVKLETSMGDIVVELNRKRAPVTVNNFLRYTKIGQYDETLFHRIISGFVVQGGGYTPDFESKTTFKAIINESGNGLKNDLYTIAMAREDDPHSAMRQFYFNLNDNESLNPGKNWGYAVFGTVIEGQAVLDKMSEVETEYNLDVNFNDVPVEPIILQKVLILPQE